MKKYASILDYSYPYLDPAVWGQDMKLHAYQKDFILRLLNSMYDNYDLKDHEKWVEDIVILGSLTTAKWLISSDMDVHVRVNLDEFIKTNMPNVSKEEAFEKLDLIRKEFDKAKILAPMTEHPIEFYIESLELKPSNTENVGVYSIIKETWLKAPISFPADLDYEEVKRGVVEQAEALAEELDSSLGKVKRDIQRVNELETVIKAWDKSKQQLFYKKIETKLNNIEEEIKKDLKIKQDLVDARHENQSATSDVEIKFKWLQRFGFFGILQRLKELLESTGGEVTVEELPLIEKIVSEARLFGDSYYGGKLWYDPSGHVYEVGSSGSHADWILDHADFLKNKYGFDSSKWKQDDDSGDMRDFEGLDNSLVSTGWARVGDTHTGWGIQVPDLRNVPEYFTTTYLPGTSGTIIFEDLNKNWVQVDSETFVSQGQKAINKALAQKRMGSIKEAGQVTRLHTPNGVEFRVFKNPTPNQAEQIFNKSHEHEMRALGTGQDVYMWDGYYGGHYEVMEQMGLLEHHGGEISIHSPQEARNIAERFSQQLQTSSIKEASEYQSYFVDPKGQIFECDGSHGSWILDNQEMINNNYGLHLGFDTWVLEGLDPDSEEYQVEIESQANYWVFELIKNGWVRIFIGDELAIQINDLNNPPTYMEGPFVQFSSDSRGNIVVSDLNEKSVSIYPEYGFVKGIKKALQHKRLQTSSLKETCLKASFKQERKLLIDFDRTLAQENKDGSISEPMTNAKESLDKLKQQGFEIEIYSVRANDEKGLDEVKEWLDNNQIPYDSIFQGEKPRGTIIDDHAIQFKNNWEEIVNQVEKSDNIAHLNILAAQWPTTFWLDPNGKIYDVKGSHDTWIAKNLNLLKNTYGIDIQQAFGPIDPKTHVINDLAEAVDALVFQGWTRVSIASDARGYFFQVANIRKVPTYVFDFILSGNPSYAVFEDENGNAIDVETSELVNGQKAINKALQRKRLGKLFSKKEIIAQTKKIQQGKFGCLMALVPHELAQEIVAFGVNLIPDDVLYIDDDAFGRELEVHCTIKYGLISDDAKTARRLFNNHKPFKVKLGKVKHFEPEDAPFDVLTVEVISEDLENMNKEVTDKLECATDLSSDVYHPHITIAYLKRDTAKEYIGSDKFEGKELELDTIIFSPRKGNRTYFSISQDKESNFILEKINKISELCCPSCGSKEYERVN